MLSSQLLVFCILAIAAATSDAFSQLRSPTRKHISSSSSIISKQPQQRLLSLTLAADAEDAADWMGAKKFSQKDKKTPVVFTSEQIAKILPHRYPFLLVDRVVEFVPGKRAVGLKCVTANEPQFTGHFPDRPIMPGVLMIEAMAQLGGVICLSPPINDADSGGRLFFFTGVSGVRWKRPVVPGDELVMEMELINFDERMGFATMKGKAYVGGAIAVQVEEFTFALAKT